MGEIKTGVEIIADERQRQIEVMGWSLHHDDEHSKGEIADAAVCYARKGDLEFQVLGDKVTLHRAYEWPWHQDWWKPTTYDRVRELAKAGALIAAEIDRLNRLKE